MKRPDGTWDQFDDYVLDFAIDQSQRGHRYALVTLVRIEGSSPRPLGAQMAVSETGEWVGYLSGGCIERAVVTEALEALALGRNRKVRYGEGSPYIDIDLPCGSAIELFFDVDQPVETIGAIDVALSDRRPAQFTFKATGDVEGQAEEMTVSYLPRRRLLVPGVGPAAVQLCRLACLAGFEVELLSGDASTRELAAMAGAHAREILNPRKPPQIKADNRTAIVFMFHDHDLEEAIVPAALETEAFYIGAMGSRATHRKRLESLRERGYEEQAFGRIRGPAGLFAGSKSAADIAMSILAEIIEVERNGDLRSKRNAENRGALNTMDVH